MNLLPRFGAAGAADFLPRPAPPCPALPCPAQSCLVVQHVLTPSPALSCPALQLVFAQVSTENIPLGPLATLMPLLQMAGVLNDNNIKNALKQVRECQEQLVVLDRSHSIKVRRGGK